MRSCRGRAKDGPSLGGSPRVAETSVFGWPPGSSAQNGSALKREFSGGSYSAKRQPLPSPSEGSLSSGGMDQGSDTPARDYDGEDSDSPRHSTASNSSNLSSPPSPASPRKTKSLSLESTDRGTWDP
ncbi:CDC42 binding protein kinase alpha [Phyllostomus discolor]|uniref:CDC42 binding protein kinase alpha n=1 Tax=Phyllostomus discolor TaxID=89673 RepID=A0A833Y342_9CHIR|nr:CDC42 binding protein kinase alpha [Phyllostomus discolor]